MQTTIDPAHLFALRYAAGAWLKEHQHDPNVARVYCALLATNETPYQPEANERSAVREEA